MYFADAMGINLKVQTEPITKSVIINWNQMPGKDVYWFAGRRLSRKE
jgi:hypothetical protein